MTANQSFALALGAALCSPLMFAAAAGCAGDSASTGLPAQTAAVGGSATAAGTFAVAGAAGAAGSTAAISGGAGTSGMAARSAGSSGRSQNAGGAGTGSAPQPAAGSGGTRAAGAGGTAGMQALAGAGAASAAGAGGATACDFSDPPADVAAWVDESWQAQLGSNIKSRKAWNLDNVMLNKGTLNLCVRWGATSAVPESVRANLAATTERWFNDWFKGLGSYGCFPYGAGIKVQITGWAVKPGKESLLTGVDPAIPVYTETDSDGEPKCPDACSSFVHWDHQFTGCKGGDAAHSDYWLWFDDNLPGGGGAAAVGGDWGLRMPVKTFLDAFTDASFSICEHEMGHGFGFQDYYDWTGSKPKGGSIMIVGSTNSQPPTMADIWLLRRTWKEMKTLRGW
jgi:hypothetical protein